MPDLLLRDIDRHDLIREITAEVVAAMRPVLADSFPPLLVDGDRMASLLSVSRPTIDRMRADGVIPSVLIGRRRLYQPDAVVAALSNAQGASRD
jgi:excisionase family DNA binding protein